MKIAINKKDLYNADITIGLAIVAILKKYKKHRNGYCIVDAEDCPEDIEDDEKRYEWVIDEIIWTFKHIIKKPDTRVDNGLRLFNKYISSFWL
jgi:hypothetical protein